MPSVKIDVADAAAGGGLTRSILPVEIWNLCSSAQ